MPTINTCVSSVTTFSGFYLNLCLLVAFVHVPALLFHAGKSGRLTLLFQSKKFHCVANTTITMAKVTE